MNADTILEIQHLKKYYLKKKAGILEKPTYHKAVDDVTFRIRRGETFGLVGESGCGKSTLARTIMGIQPLTSGEINFNEQSIGSLRGRERRQMQRNIQMVFQNPYYSLNPHMTVGEIVEEPIAIQQREVSTAERRRRAAEILSMVGLPSSAIEKYPHEFSGGQRQRVGIARALVLHPALVICDEPVSALDVSVQAQILNLLKDMQKELGLTYLFISHNLSVVRYMSQSIGVMYAGRIFEMAEAGELYDHPLHPYTKALMSAVPTANLDVKKARIVLTENDIDSVKPKGCAFYGRCWCANRVCSEREANLLDSGGNHFVACHLC